MAFLHLMVALSWLTDLRRSVRSEDIHFAIRVMAWLSAGLSAYMIFQSVHIDPLIWLIQLKFEKFGWLHQNHVIGLMGNPFQAAGTLAVLTPAVSYLVFQSFLQRKKKVFWSVVLAMNLVALCATQSASGLVAGLIGGVLASGKVRTMKAFGILTMASLIGLISILFLAPDWLLGHGRIEIWKQSIAQLHYYPILGIGLNQFKLIGITYLDSQVRWAHNEWIHFSVELGIFLTGLLAFYVGREAVKLFRVHFGMFGCFISIIILSFLHIPWHLAPILAVTGICLVASHLEIKEGV